jgi:hypothetical protein
VGGPEIDDYDPMIGNKKEIRKKLGYINWSIGKSGQWG